jgi:hypothetical protein
MILRVHDRDLFAQAKARLTGITDGPYNLSTSFLREKGWRVGVLEGANYFAPDRARMFADAARTLGCDEAEAIPTGDMYPPEFFVRCQTDEPDLMNLGGETYPLPIALLPCSAFAVRFVVLLTPDYHLFAGPSKFVEVAIGGTPPAAYQHMLTTFCSPDVDPAFQEPYKDIMRYGEFCNPNSPA